MNNKGNQIRNQKIQQYPKTDRVKLSQLEIMLHNEYPEIEVFLEPYCIFTKGEDEFQRFEGFCDEETVKKFNVHPTDLVLNIGKTGQVIFELDGPIHDIKTEKTAQRNRRYELNNMDYFVINETDLKFKLKMPKTRPLSQDQINEEFKIKLKKFLR